MDSGSNTKAVACRIAGASSPDSRSRVRSVSIDCLQEVGTAKRCSKWVFSNQLGEDHSPERGNTDITVPLQNCIASGNLNHEIAVNDSAVTTELLSLSIIGAS